MFTTQENWKAQRIGKFTASEIHRLLVSGKKGERFGVGAMTYINEKIAELITGDSKDDISGLKALEWGSCNEWEASQVFAGLIGEEVTLYGMHDPKFFPFNDYSGGSPDGRTKDAILEIKCPYVSSNHVECLLADTSNGANNWLFDYNKAYYAQMQFNMMCLGLSKGYFISYDPRVFEPYKSIVYHLILEDKDFQYDIASRLEAAKDVIADNLQKLQGICVK